MKLSTLDIRKQEFSRSFRGYDPDEVDAFLNLVSTQWQELVDELRRAEDRTREQELKLEHYMKVEEALEEALKTARTSSRQTLENAEKRANAIIQEAEDRSVSMTRHAEEERHRIRRDTTGFRVRQQEIVAKMRSFLMSEMELLSHYDREEESTDSRLSPSKVQTIGVTAYQDATDEDREEPEPEQAPDVSNEVVDDLDPEQEEPGEDVDELDEEEDADDQAPAWTIHDVVPREQGDESEDAGDEIRKIRRILDAMDDEKDA